MTTDAQDFAVVLNELRETVRRFVETEVLPVVTDMERLDIYPEKLLARLGELGLFSLVTSEQYGGSKVEFRIIAEALIELSQGWMSLTGALTSHFSSANMIERFGTEESKRKFLPQMSTGQLRCAFSMTEPDAGTDAQAIKTFARREGDEFIISGQKTWATHALNSGLVTMLVVTDREIKPRHRGITAVLIEKPPGVAELPGMTIRPLPKLGFKGVESSLIFLDDFRVPVANTLGGEKGVGLGFKYFMEGLEVGRLCVASSAAGLATGATKLAVAYAQHRKAFGVPIAQHQAIQLHLAQMATRTEAAKLLCLNAAAKMDADQPADMELSMAKLFASEAAITNSLDAMRVFGGNGYSAEATVQRYFREAPVLALGEGSNEIQQILIARRLIERAKAQLH
jgi:alkylation response protein AidB-like acyl-CoA dehydrogenase